MLYRQGQIVLVPFPFTDQSGEKKRPALVVSANWYNKSKDDCILVAITTSKRGGRGEVEIRGAEVARAGLISDCVVQTGKIFTIKQSVIRKTIGTMNRGLLARVLAEVSNVFVDS